MHVHADRARELVAGDARQGRDIERAPPAEHRGVGVHDRVACDLGEGMAALTGGDEPHGPQHGIDGVGRSGEQHEVTLTRGIGRPDARQVATIAAPTGIFL